VYTYLYYHPGIVDEGLCWINMLSPTFNNISIISWRSVLFVEEKGIIGENHRPAASH